MRMILTPEENEANIQEILSTCPQMTREKIAEWDKIGRPARGEELAELMAKKGKVRSRNLPIVHLVNPGCQDLLKSGLMASEKVSELVKAYLQGHLKFAPLEDEFNHPSSLALHKSIKPWMSKQCGGYVELWTLMLAAAKEWFPEKSETRLGHTFCVRFEIEDATWWNGRLDFQPILRDYMMWRYGRKMSKTRY